MPIDNVDRRYLDILRGSSVILVVLMHLGLSWFYLPYSQYFDVVVPIFFLISGATTWNSILNSSSRKVYFTKRYKSLMLPFVVFSLPFFIITIIQPSEMSIYELVKWFIAWPNRSIYPFDMRQLWFINTLVLLFIFSYPIFKLAKKNTHTLFIALIFAWAYIPMAEHYDWIGVYYKVQLIDSLDMPMQLHQTLSMLNFYLFGAFFYQRKVEPIKSLLVGLALCIALSCYFNIDMGQNLKTLFFERTTYFILIAYVLIIVLLLGRDFILSFLNHSKLLSKLLLHASKHSYSIFLIHTPIILIFEGYLGLNNLGDQLHLAVLKMIGVLSLSLLAAPLLTSITNYFGYITGLIKPSPPCKKTLLNK